VNKGDKSVCRCDGRWGRRGGGKKDELERRRGREDEAERRSGGKRGNAEAGAMCFDRLGGGKVGPNQGETSGARGIGCAV
jgi:hypothetical protein